MNGRLVVLSLGIAAMSVACESTPELPPNLIGAVGDPYASMSESEIFVQLGVQYMEQGAYAVALEDLNHAVEADSGNSEAYNALGVLYERLGRFPSAEQHFQRAIAIAPDNFSARNNYGRFLCARGRAQEGMAQFQMVIAEPLYRQPWIPLTNAGLCARSAGGGLSATDYFRQALERNPQFAPALLEMAKSSVTQRRFAMARAYLDRYHAVARPSPESLWMSIQTEQALGDNERAAAYAARLQREYPDSRETRLTGGVRADH